MQPRVGIGLLAADRFEHGPYPVELIEHQTDPFVCGFELRVRIGGAPDEPDEPGQPGVDLGSLVGDPVRRFLGETVATLGIQGGELAAVTCGCRPRQRSHC